MLLFFAGSAPKALQKRYKSAPKSLQNCSKRHCRRQPAASRPPACCQPAAVFVPLSFAALALDLILRTDDPLSARVLAASAQLEATLDIHGDLTDVSVVEAQAPGRAVPSAASA